jgi:hypothetical protein
MFQVIGAMSEFERALTQERPHRLPLKRFLNRHTLNVRSLSAVQSADHVAQLFDIGCHHK